MATEKEIREAFWRVQAAHHRGMREVLDALDEKRAKVSELDAALTIACADTDDAERRLDVERERADKLVQWAVDIFADPKAYDLPKVTSLFLATLEATDEEVTE